MKAYNVREFRKNIKTAFDEIDNEGCVYIVRLKKVYKVNIANEQDLSKFDMIKKEVSRGTNQTV